MVRYGESFLPNFTRFGPFPTITHRPLFTVIKRRKTLLRKFQNNFLFYFFQRSRDCLSNKNETGPKKNNWLGVFQKVNIWLDDNFMNNCLVGIVCDRDMKDLKNNLIGIRFNYNSVYKSDNECFPNTQKVYTMLETSAFFESYRHVLDSLVSLRNLDDDTFPFKKHLGNKSVWSLILL